MQRQIEAPVLALEPGQVMSFDDARGMRIVARLGTLWVTEEGDPADHIVAPGDVFIVGHGGRTVVQAIERAWISIGAGIHAANDPQ